MELVEHFQRNLDQYRSSGYKEAEVRREFIDPFFEALGWDVQNRRKYAEAYKDVVHEPSLDQEDAPSRAPDYSFQPAGHIKFFVEAKKPSVNLDENHSPALQLRRYGWTQQLPISILTNFAEFAVYDCRMEPGPADGASTARVMYLTFDEYAEHWDELVGLFSPDAVFKGSFDRFAETRKRKGVAPFDQRFLDDMEAWRKRLAENLALRNPELSQAELNYAVQQTIDRILFLRICEARGIEPPERLRGVAKHPDIYPNLVSHFRLADNEYNSGLFHFHQERGRLQPDELTPNLKLDDEVLRVVIDQLYWPARPYAFEVVPADILGQVYERFLGKVIRLTAGHRAKVEEKPEVKKAGGVYYTPTYIGDYIVKNPVGNLLEGKTPKQAGKLRILDPACGSGSFLLGAYDYLLKWYLHAYIEDGPEKHKDRLYPAGNSWKLTIGEKKQILLHNIYGVDIDSQAVEVTKLSLLLKVLEGESEQTAKPRLIKEPALPDLDKNIKCGNSLVGPDFYANGKEVNQEVRERINVFEWKEEFPAIMNGTGFDAVIGNPPYGYMIPEDEQHYFKGAYHHQDYQKDNYLLFMERALTVLVCKDGLFGMIIPNPWLTNLLQQNIRRLVTKQTSMLQIVHFRFPVFRRVTVDTEVVVLQRALPSPSASCIVKIVEAADQLIHPAQSKPCIEIIHEQHKWSDLEGGVINIFLSPAETALAAKCRLAGVPLEQLCDINVGIKPYQVGKGQPRQTTSVVKNRPFDATRKVNSQYRAYLRGSDIQRYRTDPIEPRYLKYGPWLAEPRPAANFDAPLKLFVRQTGDSIVATLDAKGFLCLNNMHVLVPKAEFPNLLFILGVANSRLLNWYYHTLNPEIGEALAEVKKTNVEVLPVVMPSHRQEEDLAKLVGTIMKLNERFVEAAAAQGKVALQRQIDATDRQIDQLVYQLYELTDDEIALVESSSNPKTTG